MFIKVWRSRDKFKSVGYDKGVSPKGWLFRIASNTVVDRLRQRQRSIETVELDAFPLDRFAGTSLRAEHDRIERGQ